MVTALVAAATPIPAAPTTITGTATFCLPAATTDVVVTALKAAPTTGSDTCPSDCEL